jgi:hypothetical protein
MILYGNRSLTGGADMILITSELALIDILLTEMVMIDEEIHPPHNLVQNLIFSSRDIIKEQLNNTNQKDALVV